MSKQDFKAENGNISVREHEYRWDDAEKALWHAYVAPVVLRELNILSTKASRPLRVLDLGCGNGSFSTILAKAGYQVSACDYSQSGIDLAQKHYPEIKFFSQDINTPLSDNFLGAFDVIIAIEVIEHLFQPRNLLDRTKEALDQEGHLILSTPYHGYWKNLALALTNKFDHHWDPLTDFGHVKFFSEATLRSILQENNFDSLAFFRCGRIPPVAKSTVVRAHITKQ